MMELKRRGHVLLKNKSITLGAKAGFRRLAYSVHTVGRGELRCCCFADENSIQRR